MIRDVETAVQNSVTAIVCPLGKFYPNKDYGSCVINASDAGMLLASARQAVGSIDGVYVKNVTVSNGTAEFTLVINDEERSVSVDLEQNV